MAGEKYLKQPLFWGWILAAIWLMYVMFTLYTRQWEGLTISLTGLLGIVLIMGAIMSRRYKNLHSGSD